MDEILTWIDKTTIEKCFKNPVGNQPRKKEGRGLKGQIGVEPDDKLHK